METIWKHFRQGRKPYYTVDQIRSGMMMRLCHSQGRGPLPFLTMETQAVGPILETRPSDGADGAGLWDEALGGWRQAMVIHPVFFPFLFRGGAQACPKPNRFLGRTGPPAQEKVEHGSKSPKLRCFLVPPPPIFRRVFFLSCARRVWGNARPALSLYLYRAFSRAPRAQSFANSALILNVAHV